jgi:HAD superfamily hydrolase (TIGR01509 family)
MAARRAVVTVRTVIFDLDGTLADSVELFYGFACEVAADLALPPPARDAVYELMRTGRSTLTHLLPASLPADRVTAAFNQRAPQWLRRYFESTEPIAGVLDAVRSLHTAGFQLGIATSSARDVPFLARWGIRSLFGAIVGREDVTERKPAPEVIVQCLERLRSPAHAALYVGDSPIDIQAGRAAGVHTVGVLSGASTYAVLAAERPDAIIGSVVELPALLAQWR